MPPLPVIADVYRVSLNWLRGSERRAVNVLHFSAPGKTETDVFTAIDAHVTGTMWESVSSATIIDRVDILKLDGTSTTHGHATDLTGKWQGSGSSAIIPQGAHVVSLRSDLRGRSNRGRVYLPFVSESVQDDGKLTSAVIADVLAGWGAFANAMATDGVALGIASYKHSNWHQATNIIVGSSLKTQRRRAGRQV